MTTKNNNESKLLDFIKKADKTSLRTGKGCVIYTRVSSKEQADNNTSLETQKKSCEEYALKKGYQIKQSFGGTFESAKSDERKEFEKLIAFARKEKYIEAIIVYSYDRFSRSGANAAYLSEELDKIGIRVIAVSQDVDTSTASGKFQRNMILMFSQYDNELRRDKCMTGTIENLRQGYWVCATPFGYDNLRKKEKARNHKYVINDEGKFVKIAFQLKAEGRMTNKEIVEHIRSLGSKFRYKNFVRVISSPFYCGYVTNKLIPNEMYKGHHPALISEELFLKANNVVSENPLNGIPKKFKIDELPLKTFAKDEVSLSPFTGYKQKGIFYYKTRHDGTCVNVNAKHLNMLFAEELKRFEFDKKYMTEIKDVVTNVITEKLKNQINERDLIQRKIKETEKKLESLEMRFIDGEINRELFEKYSAVYKTQIADLREKISVYEIKSSNLEKAIEKGLQLAENASELWHSVDFNDKVKFQYLVYPDGILYHKKFDRVRTLKTNSLFASIPTLVRLLEDNKNARSVKNGRNSLMVVPTGIELVSKV